MAFIGNTNTTQAFTPAVDFFSGNASTTAFTLSRPVASVAQVQVNISNVPQNPSDAYTVSGSTITFTSAPPSGTNNIYVYYTSPITQVIAPGQSTVTTTSLDSAFILPVADGGTGLTTVPHTVQVFTSGSGTYTTPANCKAIQVLMVGGGGGGGGGGSSSQTVGTAGGNTTFGTSLLTANGGSGGGVTGGGSGGSGGTATIGAGASGIALSGGIGTGNQSVGGAGMYTSTAVGGQSAFGGGAGGGPSNATGQAGATNTGGGGSGGMTTTAAGCVSGGGGGAGGYIDAYVTTLSATYSYAVGAAGTAGAGGTNGFAGGAGGSGVIYVTEFYV